MSEARDLTPGELLEEAEHSIAFVIGNPMDAYAACEVADALRYVCKAIRVLHPELPRTTE